MAVHLLKQDNMFPAVMMSCATLSQHCAPVTICLQANIPESLRGSRKLPVVLLLAGLSMFLYMRGDNILPGPSHFVWLSFSAQLFEPRLCGKTRYTVQVSYLCQIVTAMETIIQNLHVCSNFTAQGRKRDINIYIPVK